MIYNGSDSLSSDSGTSRSGHQSWYVFHISHFGCKYSTFLNISIIFGENLWFWPGRRKIRRYWPLIFSVRIKPGISDYMERPSVLTRWNLSISMSIVRNIMSIRRPLFSEIVSSVQSWKSLIKIILVFSNELAKNAKIFAKKIWWFDSNRISLRSLLRGTHPKRGKRKVDWNNEEQVQFISTKKRVQALISLEKFIVQESSGQARHIKIEYTMKSLILAQDER